MHLRPSKHRLGGLAALACLGFALSACASGTPPPPHSGVIARDAPIASGRIDDAMFDRAVLAEINRERRARGLDSLGADGRLARAAVTHARNMARLKTLSHRLPVRGHASLADRLDAAAVPYRMAGENITMEKVYRIVEAPISARFDGCAFTYAGSGAPVPMHSYASLARAVVGQWMASPMHRDSLLNPRFRWVATALAIDPSGPACGDVYVAQVFVG